MKLLKAQLCPVRPRKPQSYAFNSRPSFSHFCSVALHSVGVLALSFGLLFILFLLCGPIMNPVFPVSCSFRKVLLKTPNSYGEHQMVHKNVKNFSFPCVSCGDNFSTAGSFNVHFSRFHADKTSNSTPSTSTAAPSGFSSSSYQTFADVLLESQFRCTEPTCAEDLRTATALRKHMANHIKNGYVVQCPFDDCQQKFTKVSTYRTHASQYHFKTPGTEVPRTESVQGVIHFADDKDSEDEDSDDDGTASDTSSSCDSGENDQNCQQDGVHDNDIYPENTVRDYVGKFYLWLEGQLLLPSTKVQLISQEIATLCKLSHSRLKTAMREELANAGLNQEKTEQIIEKVLKKDTVYAVHHKGADVVNMTTQHMREQFYKHKCVMLEAEEIPLGQNDSGKPQFAHFINVKDSLLRMFDDDSVKKQVRDSFHKKSQPDIYQDFTDGSVVKDHPIYKNVKCIQLILFQDAYEFFPLSPAAGSYKCVGFYFLLGNIDPESRSQVDVIQLIEIVKEKDLKYFGTEHCLEKLIAHLKHLAENGIMFDGENIPVIVTHMCGDNLGQNFIGKYVECFLADYCCRFCEITKAEIKKEPTKTNPLRTPQDYDKVVEELDSLNGGMLKGIKGKSVLNDIPFFHVCNPGQPPCIGHDILEGIAKKDYALFLKYFIEIKDWVDFETLNRKIKNFKCLGRDSADSLVPLDPALTKIRGHASEVWMFIRFLPFLIGEFIKDEDDPVWQLCLLFKVICEYVFAPKISLKQVAKLKQLIALYIDKRSSLFNKDLSPKHHLLCHYPELITYFGPLIRLWTLRFEARHMFFKNAAKAANNFVNITKTLTKKYILNFAYKFSGTLIGNPISFHVRDASAVVTDNFISEVQELLRQEPSYNQSLQSVNVHGTEYTNGLWVLLNSEEKNLIVGEITMILYNGSDINFVVKVHQAENSYRGYYCILKEYKYASVKQDTLEDYHPLSAYLYQSQLCLTLKHTTPFMDK